MKAGDWVRFNYDDKHLAYGSIVWVDGESANVDYNNPVTLVHEVKPVLLTDLVKIGNK